MGGGEAHHSSGRWLAPEPIQNPGAYASQVARSVIRRLRRQLPRAEGDAEELLTTELPSRTPFDELVANGLSPFLPKPHGKVQAAIDQRNGVAAALWLLDAHENAGPSAGDNINNRIGVGIGMAIAEDGVCRDVSPMRCCAEACMCMVLSGDGNTTHN